MKNKMNMKKIFSLGAIALVFLFGWFVFREQKQVIVSEKPAMTKVGVSFITSMEAISDFNKGLAVGFKTAGYEEGKNFLLDSQNAQGDSNVNLAIAQKFADGDYDLIIPVTTPSSQAVVNVIKDKPVVFSAVADPVSAGLVKSENGSGTNVTGMKEAVLFQQSLEVVKKILPNAKAIGVIYNPGEANSTFSIDQLKKISSSLGVEIVVAPATNTNEISSAARSISNKVDAFLMIGDNTVLSGQESLIKTTIDLKKPLVSYEQTGVQKGAIAAFGVNYEKVGEHTAELAVRVLHGEKPGDIAVTSATDANLFLNKATAKILGIELSGELVSQAKQIYE